MHVKTTKNITYLEMVTTEKEKIIAISFIYLGGFFFCHPPIFFQSNLATKTSPLGPPFQAWLLGRALVTLSQEG